MNDLGIGVGLRRPHFDSVLKSTHDVDWFEITSENFMNFGGQPKKVLSELKSKLPLVCHGLGLSLGSRNEFDKNYINRLKDLVDYVDSPWFSDHLCLSSANGIQFHDLIPVLRTEESLKVICNKINQITKFIGKPFAFENISFYMELKENEMSDLDFMLEILERTDCYILLDINNVYVNSLNFKFDAKEFLSKIPQERVIQIHLAGHDNRGEIVIDTHGAEVPGPVWDLYQWYIGETKRPISTLIEWDHFVPEFLKLNEQALMAKKIVRKVL